MTPDAASAIAFAVLICVLITAGITDVRTGKIFNWLTYPAILFGLAYWTALGLLRDQPPGFAQAMIGFLAAAVPFVVIVLGGGLGFGDAKLMAAVGAISASWLCVLNTAIYALLLAVVMALAIMLWQGVFRQTVRRLWLVLMLTAGRQKSGDIVGDGPKVPFGLAVAVGGAMAAAETLLGWQSPWHWMVG